MPLKFKRPKTKLAARKMRAERARKKLDIFGRHRLYVTRTNQHIYCDLTNGDGSLTLATASTLDKDLRSQLDGKTGVQKAELVGKLIANRAKSVGVEQVVFVAGAYKYHGRVKALADSARSEGLDF